MDEKVLSLLKKMTNIYILIYLLIQDFYFYLKLVCFIRKSNSQSNDATPFYRCYAAVNGLGSINVFKFSVKPWTQGTGVIK